MRFLPYNPEQVYLFAAENLYYFLAFRTQFDNFTADFAETYEPTGPFGAKGLGEASSNPVAAAFANAIYNAIGIRFYELPITPERILLALKELGK